MNHIPPYDGSRPHTIRGSSIAARTAEALLARFTDSSASPGTRLPPERQLADELGVGRSAVREGLAALEILGIVETRPGSGTYFRGSATELLPRTLQWGLLLNEHKTEELFQLRRILEVECARSATPNIDTVTLQELAACVELQTAALDGEVDNFINGAAMFHKTLAAKADNETIAELLAVVRSLLRVWLERRVRTREETEVAIRGYRGILAALETGDPEEVGQAMANHLAKAEERLRAAVLKSRDED